MINSNTYILRRKKHICFAHRLFEHRSKCRNIHGHNIEIEVNIAHSYPETFTDHSFYEHCDMEKLKSILDDYFDLFDHRLILYKDDILMDNFCSVNDSIDLSDEFRLRSNLNFYFCTDKLLGDLVVSRHQPSLETLSKYWLEYLRFKLRELKVQVRKLTIQETPNFGITVI